ncbi:MAG: hypothetical protein GY720_19700 [bacterium]|nr:hypothetical protein [bacterium]
MQELHEHVDHERWAFELESTFPKFAAGITSALQVVHTDGALSASEKALIVAAIGAVKRDPSVTIPYMKRAIDGGITADQARGAAINILLSRGITAYRIFSDAIHELLDEPVPAGEPFDAPPPLDEILAYYESLYGSVPSNVQLAADHSRGVLDAYYLMRVAALEESPLEPHLADLLLCGVNAAEYEELFVEIHARFALRGGATPAQLVEAVACAIPFAGVAAWRPGADGAATAIAEFEGSGA